MNYYDRVGNLITQSQWSKLMDMQSYKIVARSYIPEGKTTVQISTVWLGMTHGIVDGQPIIYETMIFGGKHNDYQERYTNEEDALLGHVIARNLVKYGKIDS